MFRRELLILGGLMAMVFLMVAAAGVWVGRTIRDDADKIALDTLPGLVDAGAAMALTQDNWLRVQLIANSQSAAEQKTLIEHIEANSNEGFWRDYAQSVYGPKEQHEFRELMAARGNFVQLRQDFFRFIKTSRGAEVNAFLQQKLTPAYEKYRTCSKRLFEYNAQLGRERATKVVWIARMVPLVLAICGVTVFAFGLAVGLHGAFAGWNLASRRHQT
jgi:hypothetical protein